jgi:glycosyltransferase involved in cell wall biosynthesis
MRIAHICVGSYPPLLAPAGGAIQRRVLELARAQARRGHEVTAFSVGDRNTTESEAGITIRYLRSRTSGRWLHAEFQLRVLWSLLDSGPNRPDVIHVHSEPEAGLIGRILSIPSVLSYDYFRFRGIQKKMGSAHRLYKGLLGLYSALLPCSRFCAEESQHFWEFERLDIIYNGVNTEQFRPDPRAAEKERTLLDVRGPVILYVGRVCEQKGTDVLLAAQRRLSRRRSDANLVIAGPIGQFSKLDDEREMRRWSRAIAEAGGEYLGAVEESRLRGLYSMADVFVMPTRELEMFGMAAVEAQACGTPVVASDHGGLRETVPDQVGRRFQVGDDAALADAIEALLSDDDRRRRCGEAGIRNAQRFEWAKIVEDLEAVYKRASRI